MNWDVVSDYYPLYQEAFLLTMFIAFCCRILSQSDSLLQDSSFEAASNRLYRVFPQYATVAAAFLSLLWLASCWTRSIL